MQTELMELEQPTKIYLWEEPMFLIYKQFMIQKIHLQMQPHPHLPLVQLQVHLCVERELRV